MDSSQNHPQLGGDSDANAPMIAGRGTKIIVSARGAYLARNLRALVELMEDEQLFAFNQAFIRPAHAYVMQMFERIPEMQERWPNLWNYAHRVTIGLPQPNEPFEQELLLAFIDLVTMQHEGAGDERLEDIPYVSRELLGGSVASTEYAARCILCAHQAIHPPFNMAYHNEIRNLLHDWNIEVAWAVLQAKAVPMPPQLDTETLHRTLTNLPEMYRLRNIEALIYSMTDAQRTQFRRLLLTQGIDYFERGLLHEPHLIPVHHEWILMFKQWLRDDYRPSRDEADSVEEAILESPRTVEADSTIPAAIRRSPPSRSDVARQLVGAFEGCSWQGVIGDLTATEWAIVNVLVYFVTMNMGTSYEDAPDEIWDTLYQWHLDIVYAILTDQPIPPLGDFDAI